jgi:hypothetical protein
MLRHRLLAAGALAALALPLLGVLGGSTSLIHVAKCHPSLNRSTTYATGYYPTRPYYWNNVYGRRYYQPPVTTTNPTLSIDYTNTAPKTATQVEFGLVARGTLIAEVRDAGTFSTGALIQHQFGLSHNVFPIGTGLPQCVPLKVQYADGTSWRNPHLPALRHSAGM